MNNERNELNQNNKSKKIAQECLINENLEKKVLDKIQYQWKTLRKAFMDLKASTSDKIYLRPLRSVHANMRNAGKLLQATTTTASFTWSYIRMIVFSFSLRYSRRSTKDGLSLSRIWRPGLTQMTRIRSSLTSSNLFLRNTPLTYLLVKWK